MRSHSQIVRAVGASQLARRLADLGRKVHVSTPQRWAERDRIPGEYWAALAHLDVASLEELAAAAAGDLVHADTLNEPGLSGAGKNAGDFPEAQP